MNEDVKPLRVNKMRFATRHLLHTVAHVFLGLVTVTSLGASYLAWKLALGPVDASPAIPVLEKLMGDQDRLRFDIGALTLHWKGRTDPLAFEMSDVHLLGPKGEFMTIDRINLGLSVWRLLYARLHFNYATVQNLSVKLTRLENGDITMTGIEDKDDNNTQSAALQMSNVVNDLPSIEHLTLSDMRVIFEDRKDAVVRRFDDVDIEMEQQRTFGKRSVSGYLTTTLTGINDGSLATIDFIFDGEDKTLSTSISLDKADTRKLIGGILRAANLPMIDMMVAGRADIRLKNNFALDFLNLRMKGTDGMLRWPRNYGDGLENQKLTNFDIDVGFDPKTQVLELKNAEITMKGITLKTSATLSASAGWGKLTGNVHAQIPVVAVDTLPLVWPSVWDIGARHWLVDKMDKGRFAHIDITVPFTATRQSAAAPVTATAAADDTDEPTSKWDVKTGSVRGAFDFTGVNLDYRPPMMPTRNTSGSGLFEGLALNLQFTHANIGALDVSKGSLFFDDLITPGTGKAELKLSLNGPIASLFEYLEKEPIAYRRKVSIDGSKARGTADVELLADFPTTKDMRVEDVKVVATSKLHNLVMADAVKGMTLAGPAFDLDASENHFKIAGTGTLDGQPATISWHELFEAKPSDEFSSKLEADIQTNKGIRERFIGSLEKRVDTGIIPVKISMITKPGGRATLKVDATLNDARIDMSDPFNFIKEKGKRASAVVTGTLEKGYIQSLDSVVLKGDGIALASGKIGFAHDANNDAILQSANLRGLKMGETDANLDVTWKGEYDITATVSGNSFDARTVMGSKPASPATTDTKVPVPAPDKQPMAFDISIKTGKLFVGDLPLENATGNFIGNANGTIAKAELDGTAAGADVKLRYGPTQLLLQSPNAGAALAAIGATDRVRGGKLNIQGTPMAKGEKGDMVGTLTIENFSVIKAPALAKLINLLSVPGLLNILSQDTGLTFARAESEITWLNHADGIRLQFKDGRTSGSSLGLTFEGEANISRDTLAIQGTAVPMSEINGLLSGIPVLGDILTGGGKGGGIFAATYSMKGLSRDPDVSINPLSVLTPGILRRILFEGSSPTTK